MERQFVIIYGLAGNYISLPIAGNKGPLSAFIFRLPPIARVMPALQRALVRSHCSLKKAKAVT